MCRNAGSSGSKGGSFSAMQKRAETANDRLVLNSVADKDLEKTYQSLSFMDKQEIKRTLRITKRDVEFLNEYKGRGNLSTGIRIGGKKYTVFIDVDDKNNVVYSLRKGRKKIVEKGTYHNVANQMAKLIKQAK